MRGFVLVAIATWVSLWFVLMGWEDDARNRCMKDLSTATCYAALQP
jgi:hypothetical protein